MTPDFSDAFAALLTQAQAGDAAAVNRVMESIICYLRERFRKVVYGPLRMEMDTSDIIQESAVEAARGLERFRGRTLPELNGWARAIFCNNVRDKLRPNRPVTVPVDQLPLTSPGDSPSDPMKAEEMQALLWTALARLSDEDQQIIEFRLFHEMEYEDVSRLLDRTEAATRRAYARAIERWRQIAFGEQLGEPGA